MNKPRVVIITLLVFVIAVAFSVFDAEGRASVRPVSAHAHDLQIGPNPTPTIPYTPEAFIRVEMNALSRDGAADRGIACDKGQGRLLYGCTAFCVDPVADNDPKNRICNDKQQLVYPYGDDSVPLVGVENDYLPDVLSQEMGQLEFENITLRAGAITMRSFVWSLKDRGYSINNSTQRQVFIPYKFNTLNPDFPSSTCGLPDPLINREQQRRCDALAPRYYISSFGNGDKPTQANHFSDVANRTEDASFDDPALVSVEDPISINQQPCPASGAASSNHYGLSQIGANRWARGWRCGITIPTPPAPWSVRWTMAEQTLFHYFTRVYLRDADNGKKIISPDWRWNLLDLRWSTGDVQPPLLYRGQSATVKVTLQNTGIYPWTCDEGPNIPIPTERFRLRYYWSSATGSWMLGQGYISVCDLQPGASNHDPIALTINDVPMTPGRYFLHFDIYDTLRHVWFRDGGWPAYDVEVQVVIPTTLTPSPSPTPTPTVCGNDC
jgi:hypothetical protein